MLDQELPRTAADRGGVDYHFWAPDRAYSAPSIGGSVSVPVDMKQVDCSVLGQAGVASDRGPDALVVQFDSVGRHASAVESDSTDVSRT